METVIAKHRYTIFEKDNFRVTKFEDLDSHKVFSVCGYNLPTFPNAYYKMEGEWKENEKYGKSFMAKNCEMYVTGAKETIIGFLACGLFPCMGLKTATKVYEEFKEDTLNILDNDINQLIKVKGISQKILDKFKPVYEAERTKKELAMFLVSIGIPVSKLAEVEYAYEEIPFPKDMKERIMAEPFLLYKVRGVTLPLITAFVEKNNLQKVSYNCFKAFALETLKQNEVAGNTVMTKTNFLSEMSKYLTPLGYTRKDIISYTSAMIKKQEICHLEKDTGFVIGRQGTVSEEYNIAQKLAGIKNANRNAIKKEEIDKALEELKKTSSEMNEAISRLDKVQLSAIYTALESKVCVLTGGGGTGKTTVTKIIAEVYSLIKGEVVCLAPTGRASRRLAEVTGRTASTIHSYFSFGIDDEETSDVYIEDVLVIVDEASMLDVKVCYEMIKQIRISSSILFVGDVDQLPSVCAGAVLRDIIESVTIPTVRLENVYRQKKDSVINVNAQKIKRGNIFLEEGCDFHFEETENENLEQLMLNKTLEMYKKYGRDNVMCLCPYKENVASVFTLNNLLQEAINPLKKKDETTILVNNYHLRVGDTVMQTTRNRAECSNGDIGIVRRIVNNEEEKSVLVEFPINKTSFLYEEDAINELILAYASTIHKAQGSETMAVVTCLSDYHKFMQKRNFLYTDVSRAREELWIYGKKEAIINAIKTEDTYRRNTMLKFFLNMMLERDKKNIEEYKQMSIIDFVKQEA